MCFHADAVRVYLWACELQSKEFASPCLKDGQRSACGQAQSRGLLQSRRRVLCSKCSTAWGTSEPGSKPRRTVVAKAACLQKALEAASQSLKAWALDEPLLRAGMHSLCTSVTPLSPAACGVAAWPAVAVCQVCQLTWHAWASVGPSVRPVGRHARARSAASAACSVGACHFQAATSTLKGLSVAHGESADHALLGRLKLAQMSSMIMPFAPLVRIP